MSYSQEKFQFESDKEILACIDETLARSRKVVEESLQFTKRTQKKPDKSFESLSESYLKQHSENSFGKEYYEQRISELTSQIESEQLSKENLEKALKELRQRVREIEIEHPENTYQQSIEELQNELEEELQQQETLRNFLTEYRQRAQQLQEVNKELSKSFQGFPNNEALEQEYQSLQKQLWNTKLKNQREIEELETERNQLYRAKSSLEHQYTSNSDSELKEQLESARKHLTSVEEELRSKYESLKKCFESEIQKNTEAEELQEYEKKYQEQVQLNRELQEQLHQIYTSSEQSGLQTQVSQTAKRIKNLEAQIKRTGLKYNELKSSFSSQEGRTPRVKEPTKKRHHKKPCKRHPKNQPATPKRKLVK